MRALSFWLDGQWFPLEKQNIKGMPCEDVIVNVREGYIENNLSDSYPLDDDAQGWAA